MILKRIDEFSGKFKKAVTSLRTGGIYYVIDYKNWSFYWDGHYITKGLKQDRKLRAYVTHSPWRLKKQIIHFGDRYAYLNGPFRMLHPSNQVFLTWFHGDPNDSNPLMQHLFEVLPEASGYTEKILVTCRISKNILMTSGIPESKIAVIPLGVDLSQFFPLEKESRLTVRTRLGIPDDAICVGSFQKDGTGWQEGKEPKLVKGPDIFLEVVGNLSNYFKNLLIVLTGPARGYLKEQLEKMGVSYIHHYLSNYHDIVPYYQVLDLYVITSRSEGGPKALLESWATGVPVVSTRVGMPADLIDHANNGMLAEVDDVKGLTNSSIALIEDDGLHARCRRQALDHVKDFDWPLIAERYYQELYKPFL